jgi:acyl carrier protein phosphodiesterase
MNLLAHLALSDGSAEDMAGQLLADWVKGGERLPFPGSIRRGMERHLALDASIDSDPGILRVRRCFVAGTRRYAGIVCDLAFDHYLACHWSQHASMPLGHFAARVAIVLRTQLVHFPQAAQLAVMRYLAADRLVRSRDRDAVSGALQRIALRLRHPIPLAAIDAEYAQHKPQLEAAFSEFLPRTIAAAISRQGRVALTTLDGTLGDREHEADGWS